MIHLLVGGRVAQPCMSVHGLPETWPSGHRWVSLADYDQVTCETCKYDSDWQVYSYVDLAIEELGKEAATADLVRRAMYLSRGTANPRKVQERLAELGYQ